MAKKENKKSKVAVIREELVDLTGDAITALILNQAILSHESTVSMDEKMQKTIEEFEEQGDIEVAEKIRKNYREGWFYKSPNSFYKDIMISSRSTVKRRLSELVKMGYMKKGGQYFKAVKKNGKEIEDQWWKVDITKIRKDLAKMDYALKGYKVWTEAEEEEEEEEQPEEQPEDKEQKEYPVHDEQGGVHGEQGGVHGEQGGVHGGQPHRYSIDSSIDYSIDLEEEEEKTHSDLVEFLIKNKIPKDGAEKFEKRLIKNKVTGYTKELILKALSLTFEDYKQGKCDEPYIWAVGKLERLIVAENQTKNNEGAAEVKPKSKRGNKKPKNNELVPDWFKEQKKKQEEQPKEEDRNENKEDVEELLKKYKKRKQA